ncbi:hypothetical protein F5X68DRAFT_6130 [Plectosphaerella plurivora]|uniref:Uncharacterized protein n=1 Tax=Plectosphaerella plurivora TaxID=936078 RepID=A0A9P8VDR7_9PEZI|nr:hypothetical protein F5X68DRAFT_6130 [Plectosphaerella plurivora]
MNQQPQQPQEHQHQESDMCFPSPRKSPKPQTPSYSFVNAENPYHRLDSPSLPPTPAMSPPSPFNPSYNPHGSQLSMQHERLILELLPFKDAAAFHNWLGSEFVRGSWHEFRRDCAPMLPFSNGGSGSRSSAEPDKHKTSQSAKDAINSRKPKYLIYHPDKTAWTVDDHHIRFIATVVRDNMLQGLWSESEWKKQAVDIAKAVFEVLVFLKAVDVVDKEPPRYTD